MGHVHVAGGGAHGAWRGTGLCSVWAMVWAVMMRSIQAVAVTCMTAVRFVVAACRACRSARPRGRDDPTRFILEYFNFYSRD